MPRTNLHPRNRDNYMYHLSFPEHWIKSLRKELHFVFRQVWSGGRVFDGDIVRLPPVVENSKIGRLAGKLPSKPEGITLWGKIYYTPNYPKVRNKYLAHYGPNTAKVYEFGMYAHEAFHAIDQECTGKLKWFVKYILKLIKTPNAWKHPMEIPAYEFQEKMKDIASADYRSNP